MTIALASALSGHVTENLKFALNRANLRTDSYERLAQDFSEHVFLIDNIREYLAHGWTTAKSLEGLINEYNSSITKLRSREFVYRARVVKFWPASARPEFTTSMGHIRGIDVIIHSLNDELEAVVLERTKDKVATERAHEAARQIGERFPQLQASVERLLED